MELKFRAWDKRFKKFDYGQGSLLLRHNSDNYEKVQQYIGLEDKNGKEIYEGDVVSDGYDKYEVVFKVKKWCASFVFQNMTKSWEYGGNGKNIEVVGNIYENKELLK